MVGDPYAGGQDCPRCQETVSVTAQYCEYCGQCLDAPVTVVSTDGGEAGDTRAVVDGVEWTLDYDELRVFAEAVIEHGPDAGAIQQALDEYREGER